MSEAFRRGIRPPSNLSPPDWASKYVSIAGSERSSKFDISQTPWQRAPMECAGDSHTRQVVFLAPTGSGKSTMAEGLLPWIISEDPGNLLYASQTDQDAKFWAESRLSYALKSCKSIDHLWPNDRHKSRTCEIIFPHMAFVAGGANESNFNEKSMRYLYGDEAWKWRKGLMEMFLRRHHDRWNRKVFIVSQAGCVEEDLDAEWHKTDMACWHFECPKCKEFVKYHRNLVKYDKVLGENGQVDPQKTADTTRLHCPKCSEEFKDTDMVRRKLTSSGKYISEKEGLEGYRGFKMHRLAIWWIPWKNYTLKMLESQRKLDLGDVTAHKQMLMADDCEAWSDSMSIKRKPIKVAGEKIAVRDPLEKIPAETQRFFTLDKGGTHFWGVIRAWSDGKVRDENWKVTEDTGYRHSQLLWAGYIPMTTVSDDSGIREIQEKYGVPDGNVFVDVGFDHAATVQMCHDNNWIGVKGEGMRKSYRRTNRQEKLFSTYNLVQGDRGGIAKVVNLASDPIKDILWNLVNGQGLDWSIPADVPKDYHKHMRSEVKEAAEVGRRKELQETWVTKNRNNHLWDCEYYNVAAALIAGIFE